MSILIQNPKKESRIQCSEEVTREDNDGDEELDNKVRGTRVGVVGGVKGLESSCITRLPWRSSRGVVSEKETCGA